MEPSSFARGFRTDLFVDGRQLVFRSELDDPAAEPSVDDAHCFVRAFRKYATTGRRPTGDLQLGYFSYKTMDLYALYALAIGPPGQAGQTVVLFPAYRNMLLHRREPRDWTEGRNPIVGQGHQLDHVTVSVLPNAISYHQSLRPWAGRKERIHPARVRPWPQDTWMDLGVMAIRSPLVLDEGNSIRSEPGFLPNKSPHHTHLAAYLLPRHPIHILPEPWRHGWHLRVGFYMARLSESGKIQAPTPTFIGDHLAFGIMPGTVDGLWTRQDRIDYDDAVIRHREDFYVGNGLTIIVAYGFFPGHLRHSYVWLDSIGGDVIDWNRARMFPTMCRPARTGLP